MDMKAFAKQKALSRQDLTKAQRRLLIAGIPSRYLNVERKQLTFSPITVKTARRTVNISKADQDNWFDGALANIRATAQSDLVVGIAGDPTDDIAMAAASLITQEVFKHSDLTLRVLDSQDPNGVVRVKDAESGRWRLPLFDSDVLVIHNVLSDCTRERAQNVRDLVLRYKGILRIVVIAGGDPIKFFDDVIRHQIDVALYFRGGLKVRQTL